MKIICPVLANTFTFSIYWIETKEPHVLQSIHKLKQFIKLCWHVQLGDLSIH